MTNREAILRLSVNAGDGAAITSLHENNLDPIRIALARYFGAGPAAQRMESELIQRIVDRARSYDNQENADIWFAKMTNFECDRLRNEGIFEKANRE